LVFLGLTIWNEIVNRCDAGTVQIILNVQKEMTASLLNMAASTYLILEGAMLAQWLKDRDRRKQREAFDTGKEVGLETGREEGIETGRAQGIREERREWQAWYERLRSAQLQGRPFDEPPPVAENGYKEE
jgi:hypothetical protein